jgi:hypothetical protein
MVVNGRTLGLTVFFCLLLGAGMPSYPRAALWGDVAASEATTMWLGALYDIPVTLGECFNIGFAYLPGSGKSWPFSLPSRASRYPPVIELGIGICGFETSPARVGNVDFSLSTANAKAPFLALDPSESGADASGIGWVNPTEYAQEGRASLIDAVGIAFELWGGGIGDLCEWYALTPELALVLERGSICVCRLAVVCRSRAMARLLGLYSGTGIALNASVLFILLESPLHPYLGAGIRLVQWPAPRCNLCPGSSLGFVPNYLDCGIRITIREDLVLCAGLRCYMTLKYTAIVTSEQYVSLIHGGFYLELLSRH